MNLMLYVMLCFIWGSTWTAIKIGLADAPPLWSAALRFLLAVLVLLAVNLLTGRDYPQGWRNKCRVAWPGIFTFYGSYLFAYAGTNIISSALASVLFAILPFCIMLLMPLMVKDEKVDLRSFVGVVVGFIGVVLIFAEPVKLGDRALWGMICLILSPAAASVGNVAIKAYLRDQPVLPMTALQMSLGAILLTLTALLFEDFARFQFTAKSVGAILYLAILGSVIAFAGYYYLLQRISLIVASMVALITPIAAVFLGYLVLDEVLKPIDYFGAALVLAGVLIVTLRKSVPAPETPANKR